MKANELRIGNYVTAVDNIQTVSAIMSNCEDKYIFSKEHYCGILLTDLEPIPLTEEWLLKFGFEYRKDTDCYHYYNFILNKLFVMMDIDIHVYIKHVHQLQNLYFALTQEELTIK
jgi:hypothetical protein